MNYKLENYHYVAIGIAVLVVLCLCCSYFFTATIGQRTFPSNMIQENPTGMYKYMVTVIADIKFPSEELFLINYDGAQDFSHIFDSEEERKQVKEEAIKYFKTQFGLSDTFLNLAMFELTVNPKVGYRAYYDQDNKQYNNTMKDGGYVIYVPPYKALYGRYGGKNGVSSSDAGTLTYGHYKIFDNSGKNITTMIYESPCPLQVASRYDANYTPIDCDVKVIKSNNSDLVGLEGKAQGLHRDIKITGAKKNHIVIKNVMTFY